MAVTCSALQALLPDPSRPNEHWLCRTLSCRPGWNEARQGYFVFIAGPQGNALRGRDELKEYSYQDGAVAISAGASFVEVVSDVVMCELLWDKKLWRFVGEHPDLIPIALDAVIDRMGALAKAKQ
jgi:hypothetical protein